MSTKVKIMGSFSNVQTLQEQINYWLADKEVEIIDIKYSSSISTNNVLLHSVLIIYK